MERRHRDVTFLDGAKIGILLTAPADLAAADPEYLASPWILHRLQRSGVHAAAQTRETHPANLVALEWRQVHVEQRVGRKGVERRQMSQQRREDGDLLAKARHVGAEVPSSEGYRDRRNTQRESLHRRRDGPGVQ